MSQYGDGYVGTGEDSARIRRMDKKRQEQRKQFEDAQKLRQERIESAGLRKFDTATTEAIEHAFKNETIGLVTKAEFMQKRATLQDRLEEEMRQKQQMELEAANREKERRKRDKMSGGKPKLSFAEEEDADDGDDAGPARAGPASISEQDDAGAGTHNSNVTKKARLGKLGKDPTVSTDFLPDKEREEQEEMLRNQLKKEYQSQQDAIKAEPLEITYSYWDGQGHRRNITVKKGDTIGAFLKAARDQLGTQFRELRGVSVDNLMYIKEDIVLPQHYTFYELIKTKARGKSGPLFDFSVREDVRVVNDASKEKTDSHAGKVVERHWYDRNKHIFPANRWETYDPEKKYDSYTTHDWLAKH